MRKLRVLLFAVLLSLLLFMYACQSLPAYPPDGQQAERAEQIEQIERREIGQIEEEIEQGGQVQIVEYQRITGTQAREMMNALTAAGEDFILLDVRTEEEFRAQRIEGAMLISDYEIEWRADIDLPDVNALILIYCRTGRRSANAARALIEMGYTRVYDFGGVETDWQYDTVSG